MFHFILFFFFFFFNDTATTEIYTLSLHDALPISPNRGGGKSADQLPNEIVEEDPAGRLEPLGLQRSEEHTSELQSRLHLVCRLLLEKKKTKTKQHKHPTTTDNRSTTVTTLRSSQP